MRKIYQKIIKPMIHKMKRFRHFIRDLGVCLWRGWDLRLLFSCDINLSKIPKSTHFGHPVGIVISSRAKIGENCDIKQNVTMGERNTRGVPVIGNNVLIGAGAIILGDIKIGDNAKIAAGAIVLKDVPADTSYISKFEVVFRN
jgi:serine O-acetyltransferase